MNARAPRQSLLRNASGAARQRRCVPLWGAGIACLTLLCSAVASAAARSADFGGVWEFKFDPAMLRPGARPLQEPPPYNAEYQTRYQHTVSLVQSGKLDLGGLCMPPGMPLIATSIGQFEIIPAPAGRITILYEYESQIRRIYLNVPHPERMDPTMNGDSVGHWEGSVLVVDTRAISPYAYLDSFEGPHSDALQVQERISLQGPNSLHVDYTVLDPNALEHPWKYSRDYQRVPNGRLIDYECNENPRNPVNPDGSLGFTLEKTE